MARSIDQEALERARREIAAIGDRFRAAAGPAIRASLDRRLDALIDARRSWWDDLAPEVQDAFRSASAGAIAAGVTEADRRLSDPDVWLEPLVAPGIGGRDVGWDADLPEWLTGILRRWSPRSRGPELAAMDDPGNRIWLAMLAAVRPLDPVLEEFGLAPSTPGIGGGHYGLQPKTGEQLDPTGTLSGLWERYRLAHRRYAALATRRTTR